MLQKLLNLRVFELQGGSASPSLAPCKTCHVPLSVNMRKGMAYRPAEPCADLASNTSRLVGLFWGNLAIHHCTYTLFSGFFARTD